MPDLRFVLRETSVPQEILSQLMSDPNQVQALFHQAQECAAQATAALQGQ